MENKTLKYLCIKNFFYLLTIVFAFVFGEIPCGIIFGVRALPAIPVLAAISMFEGDFSGGLFGFLTGLLIDTYSAHIFGIASITFTILGCAAGLLGMYLMQNNMRAAVILTFSGVLIYGIISYYITYGMWHYEGVSVFFLRHTLPTVFLTTLLALPAFLVVRFIYNKTKV